MAQVITSSEDLHSWCYGRRMANSNLPQVYFDEHIKPIVIEAFKEQGYKCLLISKTKKYAGRDEKDYIQEIYAEGRLFVTSDREFVDYVIENNVRHAGILEIPHDLDNGTAGFFAAGLTGLVKGQVDKYGRNSMRNIIFYIAHDGYHIVEKGKDALEWSMDKILLDMDIHEY